ncbi:con13-like protein [Histoplasma ohiense]|nr:con13-like protein [Histoplasma ohiense (nom. inval.)]
MGVLYSLCQLTVLFGIASTQIIRHPLVKNANDFDSNFEAVLPAPQNYTYTIWSEAEIKSRGLPSIPAWGESLYEKQHVHYCKNDFSIYNVTFADCPEPWLVGHCALTDNSKEAVFDALGQLPSSARGGISDLAYVRYYPNLSVSISQGNSAIFGGHLRPAYILRSLLKALHLGVSGIPIDEFKKAVEADSCVADETSSNELKRGGYGEAIERGLAIAAYLKLVKTPPIDASCMSNQLKILGGILDERWDAPGQCPNKVAPKLEEYRYVLFSGGLEVLNEDPVPGPEDATVVQWDTSDGFPEWMWNEARVKRQDDPNRVNCKPEDIQVFNVSYPDCLDQDPWTLGRCADAQESVDDIVRKVGRLPAGLRSFITHLIAFENSYPAGAALIPVNYVMIYGDVGDSVYMHEATHHLDRGFYESEALRAAITADTCWPSAYSRLGGMELVAELGVAYLYDKSGKTLLERGYDASCLSNQFNALGNHAGGEFQRTSKCFKRRQNSRVIHPTEAEFLNPGVYISEAVMETFIDTPLGFWD